MAVKTFPKTRPGAYPVATVESLAEDFFTTLYYLGELGARGGIATPYRVTRAPDWSPCTAPSYLQSHHRIRGAIQCRDGERICLGDHNPLAGSSFMDHAAFDDLRHRRE